MADKSSRPLSLAAIMCFVMSNFGKLDAKRIKITVVDFYKLEEISATKTLLLEDTEALKMVDTPRISKRRNGDNRVCKKWTTFSNY